MRSFKSRVVGSFFAAGLGISAAIGCSASGDSGDPGIDVNPTDPNEGGSPVHPGVPDPPDEPPPVKRDAGARDASRDAKSDSGPTSPETGQPCTTPNKPILKSCGRCGTAKAMCFANDTGTGGIVGPYGDCSGEVPNGCKPGDSEDIACGNCGTTKRTCSNACTWVSTQCQQPANSCTPGAVDLDGSGCAINTYHQRTCQSNCTWENFPTACTPPPAYISVPPTIGTVNSTLALLSQNQVAYLMPRSGNCPVSSISSSTMTPYTYVEVRNPNPRPVSVSIWNSQAGPGAVIIDTIMVAYDGATVPADDGARKACKGQIGDYGTQSLTGDSKFASLDAPYRAVSIGANSSIQVYFASGNAYDSSAPQNSTGVVKLSVRTEAIAP